MFIVGCINLVFAIIITSLQTKTFSPYWFILAALWGFHDCAIFINCSSLVVSRFGEGALALGSYNFVTNLFIFIGAMLAS